MHTANAGLFKWDFHRSKCKVHADTLLAERLANNCWQSENVMQMRRCWKRHWEGEKFACLQFSWRSRGSEWPWIWISRPSTGRRQSHLLFVQPMWKKRWEKKKKNKEREKTCRRWDKVNVCMPWACCFCLFLCILALINACLHLCSISLVLCVGKVLASKKVAKNIIPWDQAD